MAKRKPKQNRDREERITMEIVVDAYGPEEQAMGWYSSMIMECWYGKVPYL
jgi:endonuclease I